MSGIKETEEFDKPETGLGTNSWQKAVTESICEMAHFQP